ncbi:MAG: hypothetical protein AAFR55_09840 [Pseudomonadota bacterium]
MNESADMTERDEIELLLPWYEMGTLDTADQSRVESYLARHPDMRAQLTLIDAERVATVELNETVQAPGTLSVERLMAAATPRTFAQAKAAVASTTETGKQGLLSAVSRLFSAPTPAAVRYAGFAVVALFLAQAAVIGVLATGSGTSPGYELASGDRAIPGNGTQALVRIRQGASFDVVAREFTALSLRIVDGPTQSGFLKVRIGEADMTKEEITERLSDIRSKTNTVLLIVPAAN